ncbi:uncharacterized protein PV07_07475 [Cladophialophora immunda]|uniref:Distal membrane-arm assembly complex protein 1-like domain-containing protein n=1 Tax=Cladophialophora immunda TaxID=569365 RepID=A0A0D2ARM5_9EURO|nr:uncharacterized protein PV07_07475 [Cladophialophora immunda]KIW27767.1 hypothetical protein PV07_07475 [Cladophialophora immunda]OQV02904.1 hypothetical protein CLAIMM_08019 [Cladophialophora immunda]
MVFKKEDKFPEFENPRAFDKEDCLSCRILGSTAFVALGGYTYFSGMQQLRAQQKAIELSRSKYKYGSRQLGILSLSATLVGLGVYRMFI